MADFEPSRNQNPELILTKLGMADYDYDYVRDPAPYNNFGEGSATWVVWANM